MSIILTLILVIGLMTLSTGLFIYRLDPDEKFLSNTVAIFGLILSIISILAMFCVISIEAGLRANPSIEKVYYQSN